MRVYFDCYCNDPKKLNVVVSEALESLITKFISLSQIGTFTGRDKPTVIT